MDKFGFESWILGLDKGDETYPNKTFFLYYHVSERGS